jgi:UDP-N-acetylglucosamine:LPS N-acetylglucosamine transferase
MNADIEHNPVQYEQALHYVIPQKEDLSNERNRLIPLAQSDADYVIVEKLETHFYENLRALIENINRKIGKLKFPVDKTLSNKYTINDLDENLRYIKLKVFQKIEEIASLDSINKQDIQKIQILLDSLSSHYLQEGYISEFHTFESVSLMINKLEENNREEVFLYFKELGHLNEAVLVLKDRLVELLNGLEAGSFINFPSVSNFEKRLRNIIENCETLFKALQHEREISIHQFFIEQIEKNVKQSLIQTLKSLYLNDLNKLEQKMEVITEYLKEFNCEYQASAFVPEDFSERNSSFPSLKNKKVIIFTCSFGTGHKITASAIKQILDQAHAKSVICDLSTGALLGRDRYRYVFKNLGINYGSHPLNGVDIFNEILKNQLYFVVNTKDDIDYFIRYMLDIPGKDGVTAAVGLLSNSWEKTQIRELLFIEKPDHIITTYHMDLNPILEVAEELGIPVLHVPTDYDMKFGVVFNKKTPSYVHFKSLIPNYGVEQTLQTKMPLEQDQLVEGVGIPLRAEFYSSLTPEEVRLYRLRRGIKEKEKVLFLSAGGNGQHLPHPEFLANSLTWQIPLRIEVIAGKNRDFVRHLQQTLTFQNGQPFILKGKNPFVTIEIVTNQNEVTKNTDEEFFIPASEISKLLDISDASVAKAGGLTVAELLFKGVPILFDQRKNPFSWELFNIEVVANEQMAQSNYNIKNFEIDLKNILKLLREKKDNFYFENSRQILCQTIQDQIKMAELDVDLIGRRGDLILSR